MLDVAAAFSFCRLPRGNRVAVITGSGGSAVWMADILSAHGLELPVLEEDIQQRVMALLPSYASAQNPVDATAQAIHEVGYARLVEIVRESQRIDTILLIGSLANEATAAKRADELAGDHRLDRAADPAVDLHDRVAGGDGRVRRSRHPLLHLDAELRPRDPRAGRLRPHSRRGGAEPKRPRRRRRTCATRSAARWPPPARC